jgi:hypothetical protein
MALLEKKALFYIAFLASLTDLKTENFKLKLTTENLKSYATHFGAGFLGQTVLNQSVGTAKTYLNLPELTQKQTAILTATGSVAATLPLMFTLNAAALLGLNTVRDTVKGEIEAVTKDRVAKKYDERFIKTLPLDKQKEYAVKCRYDQAKANSSSRHVAKAVAQGSLLVQTLVIGATALSMVGPQVIDYFSTDSSKKKSPVQPETALSPEQESLKILKELQAKASSRQRSYLIP